MHPNSGWSLEGTQDGIRVFTRQLDSLQQYSNKQIFAASLIMDISLKVWCVCVYSPKSLFVVEELFLWDTLIFIAVLCAVYQVILLSGHFEQCTCFI